jgi:hypothetical protein
MTTLCRVRNIIVPDCVDPGGRPMRATLLYAYACMAADAALQHTVAGQSLLAVGMHVCACCVRRAGRGLPWGLGWPPSPSRPSQTTHPGTKLASLGRRARGCGSDRLAGPHPCIRRRPACRTDTTTGRRKKLGTQPAPPCWPACG